MTSRDLPARPDHPAPLARPGHPAPLARPSHPAPLARRNPVAKLGAGLAVALGLLATLDPVAPAVVLAVELGAAPWFGVRPGALLRQGWPLLLSAAGVALAQLLFGAGPERAVQAAGLALRVLAIGLPGILVLAGTDPTDLADALVQQLRLPDRFAVGALAALRLLPLVADDWRMLALTRRARGVSAGRDPLARVRQSAATLFALLVLTIRRATRLAVAMDARGFASEVPRGRARRQPFTRSDVMLVAGGVLVVATGLAVSLLTGAFRPPL